MSFFNGIFICGASGSVWKKTVIKSNVHFQGRVKISILLWNEAHDMANFWYFWFCILTLTFCFGFFLSFLAYFPYTHTHPHLVITCDSECANTQQVSAFTCHSPQKRPGIHITITCIKKKKTNTSKERKKKNSNVIQLIKVIQHNFLPIFCCYVQINFNLIYLIWKFVAVVVSFSSHIHMYKQNIITNKHLYLYKNNNNLNEKKKSFFWKKKNMN